MNRGQTFLLAILLLTAFLTFIFVLPFLEYVLASIILAYVLHPIHVRLADHVGGFVSAILLIIGSLVAMIVPLVYISTIFIRDLRALARGEPGLQTRVIEARITEVTGLEINIIESLTFVGQWLIQVLFGGVPGVVTFVLRTTLGITLAMFLVFYLLRDGRDFVRWLRETSPLPDSVSNKLIDKIHDTTWGSVIGHTVAAIIQAVVAGIGLYVVGIPNVVFWTFVMVILAFLPLIGVFFVWAPAAGYLILVGDTGAGLLLFLYGLTIVSMIDYYVRPLVIDQQARLNPGVILVGVFGGVLTLGFVGLFVGPIVIGVLVAILETYRTDYSTMATHS